MSLLDLLLAVIVGTSIVAGFVAGFARVGIGFCAAIAGLLFGFWFYGIPADWIHKHLASQMASNFLGFFVVFFAFVIAGALIGEAFLEAVQVDRAFLAGPAAGSRIRFPAGKLYRRRVRGRSAGVHTQASAQLDD